MCDFWFDARRILGDRIIDDLRRLSSQLQFHTNSFNANAYTICNNCAPQSALWLIMAYKKPMPTIRPSRESSIQYAIEKIFKVGRVGFPYRNCLNCVYWQVEPDKCGKFNLKPPTEVLIY